MQDFSQEFPPYTPPAQTDARGVFVAANANSGETVVGMPGSRLGIVSPRIRRSAGSPGFQTQGFGPGVMIGSMGEPAAEVDPYGHRPPTSAPGGGELSPYGITANTGTSLGGCRGAGPGPWAVPPDSRIRMANPQSTPVRWVYPSCRRRSRTLRALRASSTPLPVSETPTVTAIRCEVWGSPRCRPDESALPSGPAVTCRRRG